MCYYKEREIEREKEREGGQRDAMYTITSIITRLISLPKSIIVSLTSVARLDYAANCHLTNFVNSRAQLSYKFSVR